MPQIPGAVGGILDVKYLGPDQVGDRLGGPGDGIGTGPDGGVSIETHREVPIGGGNQVEDTLASSTGQIATGDQLP